MRRIPEANRKAAFPLLTLTFCVVTVWLLLFSGPCDLANRAAMAAAYNFRATTNIGAGDVVVWDSATAYAVKTTNQEGEQTVAGVAAETVTSGSDCTIRQDGGRVTVNVVGSVSKGDWLITSTTVGKAKGVSSLRSGIFGRAITDGGTPASGQVYASVNLGFLGYDQGGGGVTDHGALSGLGDDDHTQYHNDTRGDVRYLYRENTSAFTPDSDYEPATKKYVDDSSGGSPGGAATNVQYNSGGSFGGDSDWTYDDTLNHMLLQNGLLAVEETVRIYRVGSLDFRWDIKAPSGLAADYTLTLPLDDGTSGQYLRTDGGGILSWAAPSGSGDMLKSVYDADADDDIDVAAGGTEKSSWTQYAVPYLSASTTVSEIPIGTANQLLSVNGGANGYTWVDPASTTGYIPFEMRLGVPENNLNVIDFRQGWAAGAYRNYARRTALSGTDTSSDLYLGIQLPSDFSSFPGSANIYINVFSIDYANNTITLTVYDDAGDPDDGVSGASINTSADSVWQEKSDQLTEAYTAGDWIWIKVNMTLDSAGDDYYLIGEGHIVYVKS